MTDPVQLATQAIPQADVLWDVIRVPIAVRAGTCDPASLAAVLGAKVARQAVYSIQAARILGLVAEGPLPASSPPDAPTPSGRISKAGAPVEPTAKPPHPWKQAWSVHRQHELAGRT